jgi:hypothetical protein
MRKMPELMIGYGPDHFPIGALCYGCGAGMPRPAPALITPAEVITWFSQAFALHKVKKHADQSLVMAVTDDVHGLDID